MGVQEEPNHDNATDLKDLMEECLLERGILTFSERSCRLRMVSLDQFTSTQRQSSTCTFYQMSHRIESTYQSRQVLSLDCTADPELRLAG